jgi:hypothetical protein
MGHLSRLHICEYQLYPVYESLLILYQSFRGDVRVCNSAGKHIGGDEWDYYCRQEGADYGLAD